MLIHESKTYCTACFTELPAGTTVCPVCGHNDENPGERFPLALPLGTVLMGKYVIGNVLGKGGFGITYVAYNLKDDKIVAIKEYLPDTLIHRNTGETTVSTFKGEKEDDFKLGAEKFYEEAKTVSRFNGHPNVINVYEFFYENNTAYFVMEYVRGIDLKNYVLRHGGKLSEAETIKLIMPILDALIVVHSVGVLHRDISPDNIFVCDDGNVKLLDFGSARQVLGQQSKSLSVILKPGFAPVEQYQTKGNQGPWTDIYSLAATMYYCMTGSVPEDCMNRVSEDTLVPPSRMGINISGLFESILLRAMAFQAAVRYQSVFQLKGDMLRIPIQPASPQAAGPVKPVPAPMNAAPVNAAPINAAPINAAPMNAAPMNAVPMNAAPVRQAMINSPMPAGVNAVPPAAKAPSSSNRKTLKIILGVIAACVVIIGAVATAALLNHNASVQTGGGSGSGLGGSVIGKTTGTVHGNPDNMPNDPTITEGPSDSPTATAAPEITTAPVITTEAAPTGESTTKPTSKPTEAAASTPTAKPTATAVPTPTQKPADNSGSYITIKGKQYSKSLTELDLSDKGLTNKDIEPLKYMVNLKKLTLGDSNSDDGYKESNNITDLSPIESLTKLTSLYVGVIGVSDLTPLKSLKNLTVLDLRSNGITSLTSLKSLTNLTKLWLNDNEITDITPLQSLTKLTSLNLSYNSITSLTPLKSLTKLTVLNLASNGITSLTPLKSLTKLSELHLDSNDITDIAPLMSLTNLSELYLSNNNISAADIKALEAALYGCYFETDYDE